MSRSMKMNLIFGMLLVSGLAQAFDIPGKDLLTEVKADIRCDLGGGGIAIALPTQGNTGRVWQTSGAAASDVEMAEIGLEMTNVVVTPSSDSSSLDFTGVMFGDSKDSEAHVKGEIRGMTLVKLGSNNQKIIPSKEISEMPCKRVNQK